MMGPTARLRNRWVPWTLAAVAIATVFAATVALTGGFNIAIAGLRFRSHSWQRPALLAVAGSIVLAVAARERIAHALRRSAAVLESTRVAASIVAIAAVWTLVAGIGFGTFANGGSDSYGYVGQARLFAHGQLTDTIRLSPDYEWPGVEATLTPLGFTTGQARGVIAPTYPPGLPLLLAPLAAFSETAIYCLVPAFGVLLIWITYRLGVLAGDAVAGAVAAALVAVSPTFLYQVVQPMSDVPCAACWLAALLLASRGSASGSACAGAMCSLAILIRPNLAPLTMLIAVPAIASDGGSRMRRAVLFVSSLAPGLLVLGWIQAVRFGSPFASGYGKPADMFSWDNVLPNLARYPRWLAEGHTPFIWLSLAAPIWIVRRARRPLVAWTAVGLSAAVWAAYLPYQFFHPDEWFYTRFLLPAIPLMLLFATIAALAVVRALPALGRLPVAAVLLIPAAAVSLYYAQTHGAFDIRFQERKYPLAGTFVRTQGPPNAFVLAGQHSGSIRYYANRPTLRWDLLSPTRLDQALATFRAQGYEPILVVDVGEYDEFKARFEATGQRAVRQLTPLAVLGDARVFAFR